MDKVSRILSKYWGEILFFGAISAYFLYGLSTDMTWMSIGADQMNYVVAAQHNSPAGLSGCPLYILLASLFVRLPGNDFWNLGLLSVLPAIGTCVVIFLMVRRFVGRQLSGEIGRPVRAGGCYPSRDSLPKVIGHSGSPPLLFSSKVAPYIAVFVFASSFSVWAESVIAETYMLTAFVSSLVIYFCLIKHYFWMAAMMALGIGLHPLGIWIAVPCLVYVWWIESKDFKLAGKIIGIAILGFVFRLRDVFTTPATANLFFTQNPYENILYSAGGYFGNTVIPIGPTIQRFGEDFVVLGSSLFAVTVAGFTFVRRKEIILLWVVFALTVFFTFASLYPQWIKYMFLPILPLSILVGVGLGNLNLQKWSLALLIPCLVFAGLNIATYSPGKTVDPQPTTARQFYNLLDSIPDNSIIVGHTWGHPDLVIIYYSVNNNDRFSYICYDSANSTLPSDKEYIDYQESRGISMPTNYTTVEEFAKQLQELNPDRQVFVTYLKNSDIPMEFGIVLASEYSAELNDVPVDKLEYVR